MRGAASKGSRRSIGTLARHAVTWWLGELASLVPGSLRNRRKSVAEFRVLAHDWFVRPRTGAPVRVEPDDAAALAAAVAGLRKGRGPVSMTLVFPLSRCFSRTTELPRGMLGHARSILLSELEVSTPFHADAISWDWFASGEGAEAGTLALTQIVLKRRDTDRIGRILGEAGITLAGIAVEDDGGPGPGVRLPVDLMRHANYHADETSRSLRKARSVLIGAAVLTSIAIVPAAFYQQGSARANLDQEIADATDAVAGRPGLARPALKALGDALEAKRAGPSTADILDALAAVLPPDSFLDHLYLDHDVLTLQGRTASSRALERALSTSPLFSVGHNSAPAAKDERLSPFTIRLKVRPSPLASGA